MKILKYGLLNELLSIPCYVPHYHVSMHSLWFSFTVNVISIFLKENVISICLLSFLLIYLALASWFQWVLKCNIITAHHFHHIKWPFSLDLSGSIFSTGISCITGLEKCKPNWTIIWTNLVVLHRVGQVINHHVDLEACPPSYQLEWY